MCPVVVVSFDLDGTLVDDTFVNLVWHEGIPQLYSLREGIPFDTAVMAMKREYDKIGKERLEWYNLQYWIRRFDLQITPHELLTRYKHNIHTYPEVSTVLAELKKRGFRLIVITNARSEFAELELKRTKIKNYFEQVFSATSDFGLVKKHRIYIRRYVVSLKSPHTTWCMWGMTRILTLMSRENWGLPLSTSTEVAKRKGRLCSIPWKSYVSSCSCDV